MIAASSKAGGILGAGLGVLGLSGTFTLSAIVIAVAIAMAGFMLMRSGIETRGHALEVIQRAMAEYVCTVTICGAGHYTLLTDSGPPRRFELLETDAPGVAATAKAKVLGLRGVSVIAFAIGVSRAAIRAWRSYARRPAPVLTERIR